MSDEQALAELQGAQEEQPQTPTPAETAYLEAMYDGKSTRLPLNAEFVINENGQVQRIPANKLVNGYRQVSHLQREQKKFKEERSKWESENQGYQDLAKHYKEIDDWARTNPDQWQKLQQVYTQKDSYLNGGGDNTQMLSKYDQKIAELEGKLSKYENMYQDTQNQSLVKEVESEIDAFKKEFNAINLDEKDADEISLKGQILKFGADHGYPTFRAAALDFKLPDGTPLLTKLLETAKNESRNATVKGVKQDHKNGILARSDKPFEVKNPFDVSRLSKNDRDEAAAKELDALLKRG